MRTPAWILFASGCLRQLPELDDPCGEWPNPGLFRLTIDEPSTPLRKPYVYVPSTAAGPRDVVVLLHGLGATGPVMEDVTEFQKLSDEAGFVLVYPNGLGWPSPRSWNAGPGFEDDAYDDVRFLDDLATEVTSRVCGERLFATGFSNGAMMAHRWGCEGKGLLDAIAPVSGTLLLDACTAGPVPVRHTHGTEDAVVPPEGGAGTVLRETEFPSVTETMDIWREINGCTAGEPEVSVNGDTECSSWTCEVPTELCWVVGWDHHWPGGINSARTDADATGEIWAWFQEVAPLETPIDDG